MVLNHLREVHTVDVVGTNDDDVVGLLIIDDVQGLVDSVSATQVPVRPATLLSRNRGDEVTEKRRRVPGLGDMAVNRVGLVLGQHDDLQITGVHDVGQSKVDQTIVSTEGNSGLSAVVGQRH